MEGSGPGQPTGNQSPQVALPLPERIDPLTAFLPMLERRVAGEWKGGERRDGVLQMPWFEYNPEVRAFIAACYTYGWVRPFDWQAWQQTAERDYYPDTALLQQAATDVVEQLITLHCRRDRFVEGHFANMVESGHIAAIVRRLATIREERT